MYVCGVGPVVFLVGPLAASSHVGRCCSTEVWLQPFVGSNVFAMALVAILEGLMLPFSPCKWCPCLL